MLEGESIRIWIAGQAAWLSVEQLVLKIRFVLAEDWQVLVRWHWRFEGRPEGGRIHVGYCCGRYGSLAFRLSAFNLGEEMRVALFIHSFGPLAFGFYS